jgi:Protein of unknown function (DUF2695)
MDHFLPHHHQPDPEQYGGDSRTPGDAADGDAPMTETLMDALAEQISVDLESGHVDGCSGDFQRTEAILRRHQQEHVIPQVLDLLRAQGAMCDCEVLLNSGIDLVFLEDDLEFEEDEGDMQDEMAT